MTEPLPQTYLWPCAACERRKTKTTRPNPQWLCPECSHVIEILKHLRQMHRLSVDSVIRVLAEALQNERDGGVPSGGEGQ